MSNDFGPPKEDMVCGAWTCPAPLPSVPPDHAQSAVLLAAVADNMWDKQVATLLDALPNIQPVHDLADKEDPWLPSPKEGTNVIWWGVG